MKVIITDFGDDTAALEQQRLETNGLLCDHIVFVVRDRPDLMDGCTVIVLEDCPTTFCDALTPAGTRASLGALLGCGHIRADEVVAVMDGRAFQKTMPRLDEAIALYEAEDSFPVISVSPARDHPCTWVHLHEVICMDLVGFFDDAYLNRFSARAPVPACRITTGLPGPWRKEAWGAGENEMFSISPGYLACPEDLPLIPGGTEGEMTFIRQGDLCRRVFREGFKTDTGFDVAGCSLIYPSDTSVSFLIRASDGRVRLFFDGRFVAPGDRVRVVPMQGNTMADDLAWETELLAGSPCVAIEGPAGVVRLTMELDCELPRGKDIGGYLVTVLRWHSGDKGDTEQFFPPVPDLWGERIFTGKRDVYNLCTGAYIQGRQQYPEVFAPSGRIYVGTMAQLSRLSEIEEFAFVEIE